MEIAAFTTGPVEASCLGQLPVFIGANLTALIPVLSQRPMLQLKVDYELIFSIDTYDDCRADNDQYAADHAECLLPPVTVSVDLVQMSVFVADKKLILDARNAMERAIAAGGNSVGR